MDFSPGIKKPACWRVLGESFVSPGPGGIGLPGGAFGGNVDELIIRCSLKVVGLQPESAALVVGLQLILLIIILI